MSDAVTGRSQARGDADAYDRLRRRILWLLPTGLYVVGTKSGSRMNLMTISWVTQVATEPKLVGVGVQSDAVTHTLIAEGGVFALSVLPRSERSLVRKFAKPVTEQDVDHTTGLGTLQGVNVRIEATGAPVLEVALAWLDCELRHSLALGSHSWFVGEVMGCGSSVLESAADESEPAPGEEFGVLRMEDTRMNYGG